MTDSSPSPRLSFQHRVCSFLTLLGLLAVIAWGGHTILSAEDAPPETAGELPGEVDFEVKTTETAPDEEDFPDDLVAEPAPEPAYVPASDSLVTAAADTLAAVADSLKTPADTLAHPADSMPRLLPSDTAGHINEDSLQAQ